MLRGLVLLLVLANGGFYLWSQGHLAAYGLAQQTQREPERLLAQVAPELLRLLEPAPTPGAAALPAAEAPVPEAALASAPAASLSAPGTSTEAAAVSTPSPAPAAPLPLGRDATLQARACWEANGFTEAQAEALRTSLALLGLPTGSWQLKERRSAGRWLVYLGRFENTAQLERKQAELRELQLQAKTVSTPGLAPGLSLGSYPNEDAARQALQNAVSSGVRTAQVAQERAESVSFSLRLPSALPVERSVVTDLGTALAGKTLQACN